MLVDLRNPVFVGMALFMFMTIFKDEEPAFLGGYLVCFLIMVVTAVFCPHKP